MTPLETAFRRHRPQMWSLAYRLTGTAADADEVVQEAFARAREHDPDPTRDLRPWLTRVAANLAKDLLRRRKRTPYVGPWLPEPLCTAGLAGWRSAPSDPEAAASIRQSVDYAWMVALEALTPTQRVVLVLRDALGLTGAETAEILGSTAGSVKVQLHRARRAIEAVGSPSGARLTDGVLLTRLGAALAVGDAAGVASLLAPDVVVTGDGAGVYAAARRPIIGARRAARLYLALMVRGRRMGFRAVPRMLGHRPALAWTMRDAADGWAPRGALVFGVDAGRVARVWSVQAPGKVGLGA
ncbi:MAG: RNA polymerase sigma-70 factor (ECF subfamily) [Myxococcota bacterium]